MGSGFMLKLDYDSERLLDLEVLHELDGLGCGNDGEGLVATLVVVFDQTALETVSGIAVAARAQDLKAFGELVHKLKGSSGSIGALALYGCCRAVDVLYKAKSISDSDMEICSQAIAHELSRARIALGDYVRRSGATAGSPVRTAQRNSAAGIPSNGTSLKD
jgi:HPt (histidine-containing phosphotransfer) domain-containing protein